MLKLDLPESTRNRVAQVKVSYEPTGKECPGEQITDLAECAKLTVLHLVRWCHPRYVATQVL